ncbi:hypothetical protein BTN50_1727 (plasmid) [Candidatus Enterovibrio altilux]|uniref:Uncharacterized protein n=1 Tax=Candidatus Enterovibrio altilux TaxID=1927128 RepID=A0A291BAY9_9GAMM|nr:hypothetical protein BTN50_1727 [Candidatus Enterovibrio luxaltus]
MFKCWMVPLLFVFNMMLTILVRLLMHELGHHNSMKNTH